MSPRQAMASALHLFVVLTFFTAAFFFVSLPYLPETRIQMIDFLTHQYERCTLLGLAFFTASFLLFFGFYLLNRGRFLHIKMGAHSAEIDPALIRQTINECFSTHFPKVIYLREIEVAGSEIEIGVKFAPLDESAREELFYKVEKHLKTILQYRFGYSKPFHLIVKI